MLRLRQSGWQGRRGLHALLCTLIVSLSLTLSACVVSIPQPNSPTSAQYNNGVCHSPGDASRPTPPYTLDATPPIVADGVVYVGYAIPGPDGYPSHYAVTALRVNDGATLWRVPALNGTTKTTPFAVTDGVVVLIGGGLVGLRASDGATLWQVSLDPSGSRPLTVHDGVLYAASNARFYAIRVTDGHVLWQTSAQNHAVLSTPVVDGNTIYVGSVNGVILALRVDTGAVIWASSPDPLHSATGWYTPIGVVAGYLYVNVSRGPNLSSGIRAGVLRVNPGTGASDGYALFMPPSTDAIDPLLVGGTFYVVATPIDLSPPSPEIEAYRLLASGGQLLWSLSAGGLSPTVPLVHDTTTLYLEDSASQGAISAFRLSDGAELWRQLSLGRRVMGVIATTGYLFESAVGVINPCSSPPVDHAPEIRALRSVDGSVAWIRALNATR